jgi:hypothetical protein
MTSEFEHMYLMKSFKRISSVHSAFLRAFIFVILLVFCRIIFRVIMTVLTYIVFMAPYIVTQTFYPIFRSIHISWIMFENCEHSCGLTIILQRKMHFVFNNALLVQRIILMLCVSHGKQRTNSNLCKTTDKALYSWVFLYCLYALKNELLSVLHLFHH